MAAKRSTSSPGRHSLMADVLRLIAEPGSTHAFSKKKTEVSCFPNNGKVTNHNYCDVCFGGGEIVCCDKCPKSYHIKCHRPLINKLPDGEWLCEECASIENDEINPEVPANDFVIKKFLKRKFDSLPSYYLNEEEFLSEVPIQRKYNVKLSTRKQLDKMKLIRKIDRCYVCKRGVLRGRLMQCSYCFKLYHLNCLDPPIRDWDHSMKFQCPIHTKFFELVYPTIFTADCGVRSDAMTLKRQRCDLVSLPVNTFFNIPSHIDAMYKEPEENIPTTKKSFLNILCDVATFELESINSNHSVNSDNNVSNGISAKFLARQHINNKFQKKKCLLPKQPTASLSCLSIPINISIRKNSFTIGKHINNDFCLLPYGNCEYLSDQHVTITYDNKLGDFLVKNHSSYGIIVDNVSYFGSHRPKEVSNRELKVINSQVKKYINKRRRTIENHNMLCIFKNPECEDAIIKYAGGKQKFDYRLMLKYYSNKLKNVRHTYQKIQCKCSERVLPKDGYFGQAILRNNSIMLIGCMKFIFTCDTEEFPKICTKKVSKVCVPKVPKVCKENVSNVFGGEVFNASNKEIPEVYVKEIPKVCTEELSNMCVEEISEVYDNKVHKVYVDEPIPEVLMEEISNVGVEGKQVSVLSREKASKILELPHGVHRSCLSEITASFTSLNNRCDSIEEQNLFKDMTYLDNNSDCEFSDSHMEINYVPNDMNLDKDNNSIQASDNDDIDPTLSISGDPTLNICGDPTLNDAQISRTTEMESLERHRSDVENEVQSCFINDLVQEVDESFSDGCEIVEEEVLFELGYNDSAERVSNIQSWIEEIDVEEYGNSANHRSQLQDNNNVHGNYKTEHMYCARSPTYEMPTIVISSDDE